MNLVSRESPTGSDAVPDVVVDLAQDGSVPAHFSAIAHSAVDRGLRLRVRLPHLVVHEWSTRLVAEVHQRAVASAAVNRALEHAGVTLTWTLEATPTGRSDRT